MERAVVLGGGVAGLLAARVLADHAAEVVVVERDDLSLAGGPEARRGVPQGRQVHGVLARGLEAMEALFPHVTAEMVEAGGEAGDPGVDCHWYVNGVRKPPAAIGQGISCTRPFLEWHLRRRLLAMSAVRVVRGHVDGLTAGAGRVDGVAVSAGDADGDRLAADLVVDCTGRSSRIGTWLRTLGYDAPPEKKVVVDLGYATRLYARPPDDRLDGAMAVISVSDDVNRARGAVAFAVEDGRWMVTVGGYHHDRPTSEPADFASRLRAEPTLVIQQFAARADARSDVVTHRFPSGVRRGFDRLKRLPGGLVAAGDSVASFNPIYGQGMTSAALHAMTLDAYLAAGASPHEPAVGYFRRLRPVVDSVWQLSATSDFRLRHVTGDKPPALWLTHKMTDLYTRATLRDADLHRVFLRVVNLQDRPQALMRPATLLQALRAARRPLPEAPGPSEPDHPPTASPPVSPSGAGPGATP